MHKYPMRETMLTMASNKEGNKKTSLGLWKVLNASGLCPPLRKLRMSIFKQLDKVSEVTKNKVILPWKFSGSSAEGTTTTLSDLDVMHPTDGLPISFDVFENRKNVRLTGLQNTAVFREENVPKGFTRLEICLLRSRNVLAMVTEEENGIYFLSSKKYLSLLGDEGEIYDGFKGPSLESRQVRMDRVLCLQCPFWPSQAREWLCERGIFSGRQNIR